MSGVLPTELAIPLTKLRGSCDMGYALNSVSKACDEVACTQGTVRADKTACDCDAGYHVSTASFGSWVAATSSYPACVAYNDVCDDGTAIAQASRTQDGHCGTCNAGYYLVGKVCDPWAGACKNGGLIAQHMRTQHNTISIAMRRSICKSLY